ncbi:MAG TPA: hypothetical protein VIK78_22090 [Ruminiclostridium sp.]
MKKILLLAFVLLLSISLFGCTSSGNEAQLKNQGQKKVEQQQTDEVDKKAVENLIENFGNKLQTVSLQAPQDDLEKSMKENYSALVTPTLLTKWMGKPLDAPGRLTSSPWPDHIVILTIKKLSEYEYEVKGEIIEITSVEQVSGGVAAKRPITLMVKKIDNKWLIDNVILGIYEEVKSILYKNSQYGFTFTLPKSWRNYTTVADKWDGLSLKESEGDKIVESGPMISIRHPEWTLKKPRQDVPIMIFTLAQWDSLQKEEFHIGAAPIGPSELGRNSRYVFALPARYNFAFLTGYEEVENILKSNPLQPFEDTQ